MGNNNSNSKNNNNIKATATAKAIGRETRDGTSANGAMPRSESDKSPPVGSQCRPKLKFRRQRQRHRTSQQKMSSSAQHHHPYPPSTTSQGARLPRVNSGGLLG